MRAEAGTTRARCARGSNNTCETGGRAMATTVEGPVGSHDNYWTSAETAAGRNVGLSLWKGARGRCPRCGRGRLFCAFLKVYDHCSVCRLDFTGHRADDLPAYLVIVIVGYVLVPVILWIEADYAPSLACQLGVYLPIAALASTALLQPVKGAVVALQWACLTRQHSIRRRRPRVIQMGHAR